MRVLIFKADRKNADTGQLRANETERSVKRNISRLVEKEFLQRIAAGD
ncbi:MAG: hypothetical protein JZU65_03695 [Chlorobium sp.]|nr:hypothetical protein [Chlorobium sp.]